MRPIIYPYKFGSGGARELSEELRIRGHRAKRVRAAGNYRPYSNHVIVNWGSANRPTWMVGLGVKWLNAWIDCENAGNKLKAFELMKEAGVQVPEFTTDKEIACGWVQERDDSLVVARRILRGHSGIGISICTSTTDMVDAPLYVKYIKKHREYRIHVFGDKVIDIQQKRRRRDVPDEEVNWQVRNHRNGFIYSRNDIDQPHDSILRQSILAVEALHLDFGAVDVIWNERNGTAYVLEVNTAPGLEGTTKEKYAQAIEELL